MPRRPDFRVLLFENSSVRFLWKPIPEHLSGFRNPYFLFTIYLRLRWRILLAGDVSTTVPRIQSSSVTRTKVYSVRSTAGYAEEYCELETFRPQCLKNEVIVIESAIYGRRYVSRCLETEELDFASNPGYLGCSADVVDYVNTVCSGKKQCEIRIPDANLQHTKPCPKGLDMFLEIRYACVEGKNVYTMPWKWTTVKL